MTAAGPVTATHRRSNTMRKTALWILATVLLLTPTAGAAWGGPHHAYHPYRHYRHHRHCGYHGYRHDDLAAGILGGLVGGILIDRVFFPPPAAVYIPPPRYRQGFRDGYDRGYDTGYRDGYEQAHCRYGYGECRY